MTRNYIVTALEMKQYDNNTIEEIGIPACVLMERAALAAVEMVEKHCSSIDSGRQVLIMAGMGNNGGDGIAAGRILAQRGYQVEIWCVGNQDKASQQWRQQREIAGHYPIDFTNAPHSRSYTVLLDALFGVGLSRDLEGVYAEAVRLYHLLEGWKLSLDIPSGVDSDTGRVRGCAVKADKTITFGFRKRGLVLFPGCEYSGDVEVADIGVTEQSFLGREPEMYAYEGRVWEALPKRRKDGNKGTFGKILLVAGSADMAGGAVLAARAAYRTGAGMVRVISPSENRIILQSTIPEAIYGTLETLEEGMEWADVIAVGPGIGRGEGALHALKRVIVESHKPLLIDADGLNLLAEERELQKILSAQGNTGRKVVLTPHVGELSRLTGASIAECKKDLACMGKELAAKMHAVVAAKDARTMTCAEGHPICINLSGNNGMATAGSGDVLAGMIAALLAQGMGALEAASLGVYIHGMAGDTVTAKRGQYSCMAGDIAEAAGICCNDEFM